MSNSNETRGRKANPNYSKEVLLDELRKLQLGGNCEKLTYSKLERITGIPRRNWNKVSDYINNINEGLSIDVSGFKCDFVLPSIDEVFEMYYGKRKGKLMDIFKEYNIYLNQIWQKNSELNNKLVNLKKELTFKESQICNLKEELKQASEKINYYKKRYEEQSLNSMSKRKRESEGIKKNVISIKKGDSSSLSLDFDKIFSDFIDK